MSSSTPQKTTFTASSTNGSSNGKSIPSINITPQQNIVNIRKPDIDEEIIIDVKVVSKSNSDYNCPPRWVPSSCKDGDIDRGCDLNKGAGGKKIYMCLKKKKFSNLKEKDQPINVVQLAFNTMSCGDIKRVSDVNLNKGAGGADIWLCAGFMKDKSIVGDDLSPLSDVYIWIKSKDEPTSPNGYNCIDRDLNYGAGGRDTFLCFKRAKKVPRLVEYINFNWDMNKMNIISTGVPYNVASFENNNGDGKSQSSVTRTFSENKTSMHTWNVETKWGIKTEVKVMVGVKSMIPSAEKGGIPTPFISAQFGVSYTATLDWSTTKSETKTETDIEEITYSCVAPAGKFYKCNGLGQNYKVNIPYSVDEVIYYYDDTQEVKNVQSIYKGVHSSSVKFERCCYKFCTTKETLCPDAQLNDTNICPNKGDEKSKEIQANEEITLDKDPLIVVDLISVIDDNKYITCPFGYEYVIGNDCVEKSGDKTMGCNLNDKAGGKFIFLCMKKLKLSEIINQSDIVNSISVLYNNEDCDGLKKVKDNLNKEAGDVSVYMCYGNDEEKPLAPITDVRIFREKKNATIPAGYECDTKNLNKKAGGDKLQVCFFRDINIPKSIIVKNITYKFEEAIQQMMGDPERIDQFTVTGGTVSKTVRKAVKNESSYKKTFSISGAVSVGVVFGDVKDPKIAKEASFTGTSSTSKTESKEWKESEEKIISNTFECTAEDRRVNRCVSFINKYKKDIPYQAELIYYNYLNKEIGKKPFNGVWESISNSEINYRTCCLSNCCEGNPLKDANKPYCAGAKKDVLCEELEKCFQ